MHWFGEIENKPPMRRHFSAFFSNRAPKISLNFLWLARLTPRAVVGIFWNKPATFSNRIKCHASRNNNTRGEIISLFFCCITLLSGNVSIVYVFFVQKICQGNPTIDNLSEVGSEPTVSRQVGALSWERIILNCQPPHWDALPKTFHHLSDFFFFFLALGAIFCFDCQRWVLLRIVRDAHPAVCRGDKDKVDGAVCIYLVC